MKLFRLRWLLVTVAFIQVVAGVPAPAVAQDSAEGTGEELCDIEGETFGQFADIADSDYGADYILCARVLGLSRGLGDGRFGPDQELDRGQMAAFLVRLWRDILGRACPAGDDPFTDVDDTHFAAADIACLYNLGITRGTSATTYGPAAGLEASQVTRFVTRLLNKITPGFCDTASGELEASARCLAAGGVVPSTSEAVSSRIASRAQMAVYLIGAWYTATNRGQPPTPPTRPVGPDTGPVEPPTPPTDPVEPDTDEVDWIGEPEPGTLASARAGANRPPAERSRDLADYLGLSSWPPEGTLTVPVFLCGPVGQYTADEVRQVTTRLNRRLQGFFNRLSSGRFDVVFSEGASISIDRDFEAARRSGAQNLRNSIVSDCHLGVSNASAVEQNLIVAEFDPCGGYGAVNYSQNKGYGCAYLGGDAYVASLSTALVLHELAHSLLLLSHPLGLYPWFMEPPFTDRWTSLTEYWTSLTGPPMACSRYEWLGWPVPIEFPETCVGMTPGVPYIWSSTITDNGEIAIYWEPPIDTDGAPVTGYTIIFTPIEWGGDLERVVRVELPANARTATLRFPTPDEGFHFELLANTEHGLGAPAEHLLIGGGPWVPPLPPPLAEVSVYDTSDNTITLTWDAEKQIKHEKDSDETLHYEVSYIAGDPAGEDTSTECPPSLLPEQVAFVGCDTTTKWVWGNTINVGSVTSIFDNWVTSNVPDNHEVFRVRDLQPSTRYTFRVRTCNDSNTYSCSRWSTVTASTTASTSGGATLPPPSGIRIASGNDEVSGDWALVTWDPVPGAAAYQIEMVNEAVHGDVPVAIGRRLGHSYDLSGDLPDSDSQEIVFRIRSCKTWLYSCGDGEWTTVSVSRPASRSTPPPYRVSVKEVSDAYTRLDYWIPSWRNAHSYTLEYQYTDGTSDSGLQDQDRWYRYLVLPTDPNKNYTVKMRNCEGPSAEGNSCSTWTSFAFSTYLATSSIPPPSLRVMDIPDDGHGVTRILWDGVPGALSYDWELEVAPGSFGGESKLAGQVSRYINNFPIPEYSALPITEPGREYTIRIRSCGVPTEPCGDWATTKFSTQP